MTLSCFVLVGARHGSPPYFLLDEHGEPRRFDGAAAAERAATSHFGVMGGFGFVVVTLDEYGRVLAVDHRRGTG